MNAKKLSFIGLAIGLFTICAILVGLSRAGPTMAASGDLIQQVYTDKARYNPGDTVTITVKIKNNTGADWSGTLYLDIRRLETLVHSDSQSLSIAAGAITTKTFAWTTPCQSK